MQLSQPKVIWKLHSPSSDFFSFFLGGGFNTWWATTASSWYIFKRWTANFTAASQASGKIVSLSWQRRQMATSTTGYDGTFHKSLQMLYLYKSSVYYHTYTIYIYMHVLHNIYIYIYYTMYIYYKTYNLIHYSIYNML